jgi:hypothetical protein
MSVAFSGRSQWLRRVPGPSPLAWWEGGSWGREKGGPVTGRGCVSVTRLNLEYYEWLFVAAVVR